MLGNPYQPPSSARPKDAPTTIGAADSASDSGNPLRKGAILALMALAAGLFTFFPRSDESDYSLQASPDASIASMAQGAAELAPADGERQQATAARRSTLEVERVASGPDSLSRLAGQPDLSAELVALQSEIIIPASGDESTEDPEGDAAVAAPASSTTTEARRSTTTAEETTTTAAETSTTATAGQPTTTAEPVEDPTTTAAPVAADAAPAGASDSTVSETTVPETTVPETTVPETTVPETTVPETTPAPGQDGWVDTGNGVMVPPILLKIRHCESTDNYTAANPWSSARGGYQFLTGSWAAYGHKERYGVNQAHLATPAQQDEAALITWERDGTRPWNASRHCWG